MLCLGAQSYLTQRPHGLCPWGFSRQEYWSGLPCPSPGDPPNPGIKPRPPALQVYSIPPEPPGKTRNTGVCSRSLLQENFPTQELNWGQLNCIGSRFFTSWATWEALTLPCLSKQGKDIRNRMCPLDPCYSKTFASEFCSSITYSRKKWTYLKLVPAWGLRGPGHSFIIIPSCIIILPSVQLSLSRVWLFATPWTAACQASESITNSRSSLKRMSIESVMPSNHPILCCPLLLPPRIFLSIRVFSKAAWGGQSIGVSASASVLPMNIQDWFLLEWTGWIPLQSKGLFKSLLQYHNSKASILQCSAFFIVQLSLTSIHDYWKNHSLDLMDLCWQSNVTAF